MISIGADSSWLPMAKEQYLRVSWGQVWSVVVTIVGAFAVLIGVIYSNIQDRLLSIDTSISGINITERTQGESLARLEGSFNGMDRRVTLLEKPHYESKAKALGFKNPHIIPASLKTQATLDSQISTGAGQHSLRYTILKYDRSTNMLTVSLSGQVGSVNLDGNILDVKVEPGSMAELPTIVTGKGVPKIFVQVLDRPSPDRAILAIGQKTESIDKSS